MSQHLYDTLTQMTDEGRACVKIILDEAFGPNLVTMARKTQAPNTMVYLVDCPVNSCDWATAPHEDVEHTSYLFIEHAWADHADLIDKAVDKIDNQVQ